MVKNVEGGKHKSYARKNATSNKSFGKNFRQGDGIYEKYAIVSKIFGGNQCEVTITAEQSMRCEIRGKFREQFKRTNTLIIGSYVLVGLRDWEAPKFKIADLLHIYDPHHHSEFQELYGCSENNISYNQTDDVLFESNSSVSKIGGGSSANASANELEENYDAFLDI